jgi:PAS domain S-box-containing protein
LIKELEMKNKDQKGDPRIEALLMYADNIIATLREPFLVLDKNLKVVSANQAFHDTFKAREKDTIGRPLPDLGDGQWNIPKLLELLKDIIPAKKLVKDYEVEYEFEGIGERAMMLNASQVHVPGEIAGVIAAETEELILLSIEDITERKRFQRELKESEERYRRAFETSRDGLLLVHKTGGDILNSNESARELLGYSREDFLKKKIWDTGVTKSYEDFKEMMARLEMDGVVQYKDIPVKTKQGATIASDVFLVDKAKVAQCNIRDITERNKNEAQIKIAEERYRTFFESANDAIFVADPETRELVDCNKKAESLMGRTKEEILSMRADQLHPEDVVKETMDIFKKQSEKEDIMQETLVLAKDGKRVPVSISTALTYVDGKKYLIGIFRDISERKKMQDVLYESERMLEGILRAVRVGIGVIEQRTIKWTNEYLAKMLGYSVEEMRGNNTRFLYVSDEDYERVGKVLYDQIKDKQEGCMEMRLRKKDGQELDTLLTASFISGADPSGSAVFAIQDITEQKKAKDLLLQNEQRFKALFMESPVSIIIHDKETGEIVDANPEAYKAYGFSSLEELKANDFWTDPPYSAKESLEWIHKAHTEANCCFEWMSRKVTGEIFWEYVCLRKAKIDNIERILATCIDITENKKLEKETRKHIHDLEVFYKASMGREERILELKKEIEILKKELGK